jgi:hypothetical protein
MINFNREEIVDRGYNISYTEFMCNYYSAAMIDSQDPDVVIVYVHSGLSEGNMSYAFDVPLIKGCDVDNVVDVKKMIKSHFRAERKRKEDFKL